MANYNKRYVCDLCGIDLPDDSACVCGGNAVDVSDISEFEENFDMDEEGESTGAAEKRKHYANKKINTLMEEELGGDDLDLMQAFGFDDLGEDNLAQAM